MSIFIICYIHGHCISSLLNVQIVVYIPYFLYHRIFCVIEGILNLNLYYYCNCIVRWVRWDYPFFFSVSNTSGNFFFAEGALDFVDSLSSCFFFLFLCCSFHTTVLLVNKETRTHSAFRIKCINNVSLHIVKDASAALCYDSSCIQGAYSVFLIMNGE